MRNKNSEKRKASAHINFTIFFSSFFCINRTKFWGKFSSDHQICFLSKKPAIRRPGESRIDEKQILNAEILNGK